MKIFKTYFFENSFNKDKSVGLLEILDPKRVMKYALFVKLWMQDFTIARVVKLLNKGLCLEEFNSADPKRTGGRKSPTSCQLGLNS